MRAKGTFAVLSHWDLEVYLLLKHSIAHPNRHIVMFIKSVRGLYVKSLPELFKNLQIDHASLELCVMGPTSKKKNKNIKRHSNSFLMKHILSELQTC